MRKIFLMLLCVLTVFTAIGCENNKEEKEEFQVAGRENDFFNVKVSYEKTNEYGGRTGTAFVIKVAPKTSKYKFGAANDMEVMVRYSCTNKDTGEFKSNETMIIDVEYDPNGYGYKEKSLSATWMEDIIILSYEASVSRWETATTRLNESNGDKITLNQSNILQYLEFDHDITGWSSGKIDFDSTIYPIQHGWYEINEIYVLATIEFNISYRCDSYLVTCEAYNNTSFQLTFSFYETGGLDSSIDGGIDRYTLPGICGHSINEKTLEVNFRIVSVEGYYII